MVRVDGILVLDATAHPSIVAQAIGVSSRLLTAGRVALSPRKRRTTADPQPRRIF